MPCIGMTRNSRPVGWKIPVFPVLSSGEIGAEYQRCAAGNRDLFLHEKNGCEDVRDGNDSSKHSEEEEDDDDDDKKTVV